MSAQNSGCVSVLTKFTYVAEDPHCTCCVRMELDSPDGYAELLVPRDCFVEILTRTAFLPGADQAAEVERWLAEVTL